MKKLWPRSIAGRMVLVLMAGLVISHVISLAILSDDRRSELASLGGQRIAQQITDAYDVANVTAPADRNRVIRAMWGPGLSLTWTQTSMITDTEGEGWRGHLIRKTIAGYLDNLATDRIRVAYRTLPPIDPATPAAGAPDDPMHAMGQHMGRMMADPSSPMQQRFSHMSRYWQGGEVLAVSLRLDDGSWINAAAPAVRLKPFWWSKMFGSIVILTLLIIAISVWAVHRSTAPLALFAKASERLGRDVNAPPLPEDGPREVRRASRAFNEMQRRLRAYLDDRMQMLAAISHDLRTPITRMRLRAEFIADEEQQKKMLADLDQMEQMITATLAFARDEASAEPSILFDLAAMLESLIDDDCAAGANASYHGPETLIFTGRPIALKRAFQNLIDNAVKYGGRAAVTLAEDKGQGRLVISVADDGPGIPEAEQKNVFAPFYRVERSRSRDTGGVGLGLAVVRSVVGAHGGEVTFAAVDGGGFRVMVSLPGG